MHFGLGKFNQAVQSGVLQRISRGQALDFIAVVGYFHHKNNPMRRTPMQAMLSGIPGLTVKWTMIPLGTAARLHHMLNTGRLTQQVPRTRIRIQTLWSASMSRLHGPDAPPERLGPAVGSRRPPLAALDSILNAIGSDATALQVAATALLAGVRRI